MLRARLPLGLLLTFALLHDGILPARAGAPVPLDYKAYDGWNAIRTPAISDDGTHLAYALTPEDGDPTLVVRDLRDGTERREPRGAAPAFTADGRFVVYVHVAAKKDVDAAKKAKKPEAQQPKAGIGIIDLTAPAAVPQIVDNIKQVVVPLDAGDTIAYRAEPSPTPAASAAPSAPPSPMPSPAASAPVVANAPSPSPSPSSSPAAGADKTKEPGSLLTILDLATAKKITAPDGTAVAVSRDDAFVAYATETKSGSGDGLHVYDVRAGRTIDVLAGAGRYRNLAFARDGATLAFLSDTATYAQTVPHDALYVVDLRAETLVARKAVDVDTPGVAASSAPSANGDITFSRDGKRVFFGTAAAPTPMPSGTPVPMNVDLWTWHDDVLQSQQKHDADQERKRTYLAVYDVPAAHFTQLGALDMRTVIRNDNPNVALGVDDRAYRRSESWLGDDYRDLYALPLAGGRRTLLAKDVTGGTLSPGGKYALVWDERSRHWMAIRTADGKRTMLAPHAGVAFWNVDDDHPAPPPPYGSGGWFAGDRGVMIYDQFDVWLADPDTGNATNLTRGLGRLTRTVYSPVQPDPDADAFARDRPLLLSLIDMRSYASGYAEVAPTGGAPRTLLKADAIVQGYRDVFNDGLHDHTLPPLEARHAERYVFSRESFRAFRDLWASDTSFTAPARVTDANPQQAGYRWGSEHLIAFRAADGTPSRAILIVPDGLARNHSAPLLTYFYETFSSYFHHYYTPAPGTSPNVSRYVSNGYVVLLPDVHYTVGHPGDSALNCILPAVDAAIASGYVDPKRLGMAGHSWAAYQINYMITKTHRFRAVEAGAAVDDMIGAYGGIRLESGIVREAQYERGQSRIGPAPWDRPDLYIENSGLFGIKNVTTPYLTIHNELDGAVPQFEGIEYITAMRRLGKEAYLFSFDGEDHNLKGREQQKYWTVHLDEWFDYWLKGAPRPSWMDGVDYLHRGERDVRPLYGEPD